MKKIGILGIAMIMLFGMSAMAQSQLPRNENGENHPGGRPQMTAQLRADMLAKDLSLTDEQKTKVQALFEKNNADFAKLRTEVKRDDPNFRTKMKELRDSQDADLKAIIGNEKFDQWQKMREERMSKMRNMRPEKNN
jgi:Spy/CpxP family protein refolding chaperone